MVGSSKPGYDAYRRVAKIVYEIYEEDDIDDDGQQYPIWEALDTLGREAFGLRGSANFIEWLNAEPDDDDFLDEDDDDCSAGATLPAGVPDLPPVYDGGTFRAESVVVTYRPTRAAVGV